VALAFCGAGSESEHAGIDAVIEAHGSNNFASEWLRAKSLDWAADLMSSEFRLTDEALPWRESSKESEDICAAE